MTIKKIKPSASQRAVKRLAAQIEQLGDNKARTQREFADYKLRCENILEAARLREARTADALTNNNVKITELENQVANQHRENATIRSDLAHTNKIRGRLASELAVKNAEVIRLEQELTGALLREDLLTKSRPSVFERIFGTAS